MMELLPVEDHLVILDLYARQSHAIDSGDAHGWAGTYTVDGVFESPTYQLSARGTAQLADFARSSNGAALERGEQLRHWVSAITLDRIDEVTVAARAYLMIIASSTTGTCIDRSLRLEDELRKVDGHWLFSSRPVIRDDAGLPGTPSSGPEQRGQA